MDIHFSAAKLYVEAGFPVLLMHAFDHAKQACTCGNPNCKHPGKHPRTPAGRNDATIDLLTVHTYWKGQHAGSNIAVVTGLPNGRGQTLMALEIDDKPGDGRDGLASLRRLESKYGPLPTGYRQTTNGSVSRIFFWLPDGVELKSTELPVYPGIEVKHIGGNLNVWPSNHPKTDGPHYEPVGLPEDTVEAPHWLISLCPVYEPKADLEAAREAYKSVIEELVEEAINKTKRDEKPVKRHDALGWLIHEGVKHRLDIYSIRKAAHQFADLSGLSNDRPNEVPGEIDRWLDTALSQNRRSSDDEPGEVTELWGFKKPAERESIVRGLFWKGWITILAGHGGVGKSFLAIYLMLCMALGRPFFGLPTKPQRVLYVDFELDLEEQQRRIWAVLQGLGLGTGDERLVGKVFYYKPSIPSLSPTVIDEVLEIIQSKEIDFVILDSLTVSSGVDTTSQRDLVPLISRLRTWGSMLALDHTTKAGSQANVQHMSIFGSVFKHNLARSTFYLRKREGVIVLHQDKNNFGPQAAQIHYVLDFESGDCVKFRLADESEKVDAIQDMPALDQVFTVLVMLYDQEARGHTAEEIKSELDEVGIYNSLKTIRNKISKLKKQGRVIDSPNGDGVIPVMPGGGTENNGATPDQSEAPPSHPDDSPLIPDRMESDSNTGLNGSEPIPDVPTPYRAGNREAGTPQALKMGRTLPLPFVSGGKVDAENVKHQYITTEGSLNTALQVLEAYEVLAIDFETYSKHEPAFKGDKPAVCPHRAEARLLSIYAGEGMIYVIDLQVLPDAITILTPLWGKHLIAHNAVFEAKLLLKYGVSARNWWCTQILHLCTPPTIAEERVGGGKSRKPPSLFEACRQYLGNDIDKDEQLSDFSAKELTERQIRYSAHDSYYAYHLAHQQFKHLAEESLWPTAKLACGAIPFVAESEYAGLLIDTEALYDMNGEWVKEKREASTIIVDMLGNVALEGAGSGALASHVEEHLKQNGAAGIATFWRSQKTNKNGSLSLSRDVIESVRRKHEHPLLDALLTHSRRKSHLSLYGDKFLQKLSPITGRLHGRIRIASTRAGRFSSSEPNLQNFPRSADFRSLIKAPVGYVLVCADYGQIELRVAAIISGDVAMIRAFAEGEDLHQITASRIYGVSPDEVTKEQRSAAKICNFGSIYGMGPGGLRNRMAANGVDISKEHAEEIFQLSQHSFPQLWSWIKRVREHTKANGGLVKTVMGRCRILPTDAIFTKAINSKAQGSAAEVVMAALPGLMQRLSDLDAKPLLMAHDEILLECREADAGAVMCALEESMKEGFLFVFRGSEHAESLTTGLVAAHAGKTWAAAKPE